MSNLKHEDKEQRLCNYCNMIKWDLETVLIYLNNGLQEKAEQKLRALIRTMNILKRHEKGGQ